MFRFLFWWRPPCLLRAVIVNLKDDPETALRGVVARARGPWLILANPELIKPQAEPARLVGEVHVHRSNLAFLQVLT